MLTADNISAVPGRVGRPSPRRSPKLHSDVVAGEAPLYKRRASTGGLAELLDQVSNNNTLAQGNQSLHGETMPSDKRNGHTGLAEKIKNYRPTDKEPFMNERQREYFRTKLLAWKEDIIKEAKETLQHLQDENQNHPDLADRASSETDRSIELRARDRQRKLIAKIEAALTRLEDGTYGYCEETGDPISIRRLEARPIATLSIEAQERHERRERVYRDS